MVVAETPAGYQIIAGERRWRASRLAGLTQVPVKIIKTTPQGMLEMALVENVQRSDLNPIDRANSFERLMKEFSLTNLEIATRIGKSPSFVSNTLKLLDLPDALKDGLISGVIAEGHARALAGIPDTQSMIEGYKIILREGGSVRRAEELARRFKKTMNRTKPSDGFDTKTVNEFIDQMASKIQTSIGQNSKVKMRRSRVETAITIVLRGNPQETENQVQQIYSSLTKDSLSKPLPESQPPKTTSTYKDPFEPIVPVSSDSEY